MLNNFQFLIFNFQLLIVFLFSFPLLGNLIEIKDLDTSLIHEKCAQYDGKTYSKEESLKILRTYLLFFSGDPKDPITVKKYMTSALDQYFSFKALFELARDSGCAADIDNARKLYENYSSKQSPSKLIEELTLLQLSKEEIIRSIYEKQSVQNYRIKLLESINVGEAEAMLFYHKNPQKFIQEAGRSCQLFQLEKELNPEMIQGFSKLLQQGMSIEKILQSKTQKFIPLPEIFVRSSTDQKSPFYPLVQADTQEFIQIQSPAGPILCLPGPVRKESKLSLAEVSDKIIANIKNHRLKEQLRQNTANHLQLQGYKNFLK